MSHLRRNAAGVQLLSPHMQAQIFPGESSQGPPRRIVDISLKHLADNDLKPSGAAVLPEINFDLPKLEGNNIREHFYRLGEQSAEPYLGLSKQFAEAEIPETPKQWHEAGPGWVRYESDGSVTKVDDLGGERMICFDVEVLYKISSFPVMATAATPTQWYSWLSPSIFELDQSEPSGEEVAEVKKRSDVPRDLIPLTASRPEDPALIVGHNVGYDRARVKDEYHIKLTGNRWLDTLSLHVATKGMTTVQRKVWMKRRKEKKEEEEMGEEADSLIRSAGDSPSIPIVDAEGAEDKQWQDVTAVNSLAEVYKLHYGGKMDKQVRSRFGDDSIKSASQIRPELQRLLAYCGEDVRVTHAVLRKTLPLFLDSCRHPASFAGALGMGNPFLPINKTWKEYINRAERTFRSLEGGIKGILLELAYKLKERGEVKGDPWSDQLDWSLKAPRWNDEEVRGPRLAGKTEPEVASTPDGEGNRQPPTEGSLRGAEAETSAVIAMEPHNDLSSVNSIDRQADVPVEDSCRQQARDTPDFESGPIPRWLRDSETSLRHTFKNALGDTLPFILHVKFKGHPIVESSEYRWIVRVPKTESESFATQGIEGPITFNKKKEDAMLVAQTQDYDFFRLGKVGSTKVTSVFTKRLSPMWKSGDLECSHPEIANFLVGQVDRSNIQKEIQAAVQDFVRSGEETPWGSFLSWDLVDRPVRQATPVSDALGSLSLAKKKALIKSSVPKINPSDMWPKWFWDLAPPRSRGLPIGELDLTVKKRVTPYLLRLQWKGFPLYYSADVGWVYRVPREQAVLEGDVHKAAILSKDSKLILDLDGIYCKLPHPSGEEANVGNPLSKNFMRFVESGDLASSVASGPGEDQIASAASDAVNMNAQCSYWISARERIIDQMDVYHQDVGGLGLPSEVEKSEQLGMILPQVLTMGTVTRRAMESTWLTASNAKKNRVGSEVKAMIRAPPGYAIVGADVDSEELWIASAMGDAQFGMHGASAIGWMTLEGTKIAGTDLHSKTAKILKTKRDNAKVFNYSRIYGAGKKHAIQLLLQNDPTLDAAQAGELAEALYQSTKGVKTFTQNANRKRPRKLEGPRHMWHGGSESYLFNTLELIASSGTPQTPALGCGVTDALRKKYLTENMSGQQDYLPSRINWVVQSSGVDYLHLLIVSMDYLIKRYSIDARYMISVHDELRYMVKESDKYRAALALQIANIWTRALFCYNLGMKDLPQGVAFFSLVDIDHIFRKEVDMACITPSQPEALSPGESVDIAQVLDLTGGSLGDVAVESPGPSEIRTPEPISFFSDLRSEEHIRYLEAQASRGTSGALAYLAAKNGFAAPRRFHDRDDDHRHYSHDIDQLYQEAQQVQMPTKTKRTTKKAVTGQASAASSEKSSKQEQKRTGAETEDLAERNALGDRHLENQQDAREPEDDLKAATG